MKRTQKKIEPEIRYWRQRGKVLLDEPSLVEKQERPLLLFREDGINSLRMKVTNADVASERCFVAFLLRAQAKVNILPVSGRKRLVKPAKLKKLVP